MVYSQPSLHKRHAFIHRGILWLFILVHVECRPTYLPGKHSALSELMAKPGEQMQLLFESQLALSMHSLSVLHLDELITEKKTRKY